MRGRNPDKFELRAKDEDFLRQLLREGRTPLKVARRARILLKRAEHGQRVATLGAQVEQDTSTIWRVCQRYHRVGLPTALYDAPRSGRPRVFSQKAAEAD